MKKVNLIHLKNYSIFDQLKLEETLLDDDNSYIIINEGSPLSIVLGVMNDINKLVNVDKLTDNIPLIRRFSGGGSVIVDENTIFLSFIFSKKDYNLSYPEEIFNWIYELYKFFFNNLPFDLIENDFVINNKKFCGNAQYIKKNKWLHHSSMLWDYKSTSMNILKLPEKIPKYRKNRPHDEFLTKLKNYFDNKTFLIKQIIQSLEKHFILNKRSTFKINNYKTNYKTKLISY